MESRFHTSVRLAEGGRIVIPAEVRKRLGVDVGAELVLAVEDDRATLMNAKSARRRARELVRKYIKPDRSLSQELMAERKREAERE
jgi:AbrB family looped-hinge helix DNA binding protein